MTPDKRTKVGRGLERVSFSGRAAKAWEEQAQEAVGSTDNLCWRQLDPARALPSLGTPSQVSAEERERTRGRGPETPEGEGPSKTGEAKRSHKRTTPQEHQPEKTCGR